MNNTIPVITDPLGKNWEQPDLNNILVDDTHALMSENDLKELLEYSTSTPTGVYAGKMWKTKCSDTWFLRWFAICEDDPDMCITHHREIILI